MIVLIKQNEISLATSQKGNCSFSISDFCYQGRSGQPTGDAVRWCYCFFHLRANGFNFQQYSCPCGYWLYLGCSVMRCLAIASLVTTTITLLRLAAGNEISKLHSQDLWRFCFLPVKNGYRSGIFCIAITR